MIYVKLPFRILCSLSSQLFDKFFVFSSFFSTPVRDNKNVIKLIIVFQILRFQQQLKSSWSMAKWYFKRSAPRTIWCANPFTIKLSIWFRKSCSLHNLKRQLSIVVLIFISDFSFLNIKHNNIALSVLVIDRQLDSPLHFLLYDLLFTILRHKRWPGGQFFINSFLNWVQLNRLLGVEILLTWISLDWFRSCSHF